MIAGHFGLAAAVKSRAPRTPLWALMLATVWLDIVFVPLLLAGVESMQPIPGGVTGAFGQIIIHADWTHSLVGALVLSGVIGAAGAWIWGRNAGLVLGAVSFSHWLLDLVNHRADMPVLPANWGGLPLLGFGLWASPWIELMVEAAIVLVGALLYWRTALAVSTGAGEGRTRPAIVAALIAAGGLAIIAWQATTISA
jgi:membrane-bound metal-dependent hydrolase YbcI (DUF457 family)